MIETNPSPPSKLERPMRFGIASDVLNRFPEYCVGLVVTTGVKNAEPSPEAEARLKVAVARARQTLAGAPLNENPRLKAWLEAFRAAGINPEEFP
ncbi:MAG TPA: hypothetical protein VFZ25_15820, partial [Chloroflexota bacterium]|nr:hypothetical protein [Chloroflexota bacterium]